MPTSKFFHINWTINNWTYYGDFLIITSYTHGVAITPWIHTQQTNVQFLPKLQQVIGGNQWACARESSPTLHMGISSPSNGEGTQS